MNDLITYSYIAPQNLYSDRNWMSKLTKLKVSKMLSGTWGCDSLSQFEKLVFYLSVSSIKT